jgi:hypothetical protein
MLCYALFDHGTLHNTFGPALASSMPNLLLSDTAGIRCMTQTPAAYTMCFTTHYVLPPPSFLPIIHPTHQLTYPYTLVGCATPTLLYACPFPVPGGPAPVPPNHPPLPTNTASSGADFVVQEPRQNHGDAALEPVGPPEEHPFGLPQNIQPALNPLYFTPEDMALLDLAFPENSVPAHNLYLNPSDSRFPVFQLVVRSFLTHN